MSRQTLAGYISLTLILVVTSLLVASPQSETVVPGIRRLTQAGNGQVQYPCLSGGGDRMAYLFKSEESGRVLKEIRVMDLRTGRETEIYKDGQRQGSPPLDGIDLLVGSKPPLLSADGRWVVFTLTLDSPEPVIDHYLAVVPSGGGEVQIIAFPLTALEGLDFRDLEFQSAEWERVANFAVSSDGNRVACLLKGFLGPRRYGTASGIVLLDLPEGRQRILLAPGFSDRAWVWDGFPRSPGTGGGWGFALSGNGERLIFGAQNSESDTDFDLYRADWSGRDLGRITRIQDRWINLAEIDESGDRIVFYYAGKKLDGLGTYVVNADGTDLKAVNSPRTERVDFVDISGNGRILLHKDIYTGLRLDLLDSRETLAFDENTPGYVRGLFPMDFPAFPSFWNPRLTSTDGSRILLAGPADGGTHPEIYLLEIDGR